MITINEILSKLPELTEQELGTISEEIDEILGNGSLGGKIRRIIKNESMEEAIDYLVKGRGWSLEQSRIFCNQAIGKY